MVVGSRVRDVVGSDGRGRGSRYGIVDARVVGAGSPVRETRTMIWRVVGASEQPEGVFGGRGGEFREVR